MITLGGGCFWCVEAVFNRLRGVSQVESGYSNGNCLPVPGYREVCTGTTGYAEVVQVTYDDSVISTRELLEVFFSSHNPSTKNQQGADWGTQYRSAIFYHDSDQATVAQEVINELVARGVVVTTEVEPVRYYGVAEQHHQDYYNRNPYGGYCTTVIEPKITKLAETYPQLTKVSIG